MSRIDFIKLTTRDNMGRNGQDVITTIYVRREEILSIVHYDETYATATGGRQGTSVNMTNGNSYFVRETSEEVINQINLSRFPKQTLRGAV